MADRDSLVGPDSSGHGGLESRSLILHLAGVRKSYNLGTPIETEILHGIDLTLARGEFAALIGPSGSGKSTLLHILGLLERPTGGSLEVAGQDIATLDDARLTELRGRTLGFIFQFHHLLPGFSAIENVMMPTLIDRGRVDAEMRARALWLLDRVGLKDAADKRPSALSGGMQQRVAIARSLAMNPPLILADEPTGNLDTHTADDIFALMRDFNKDEGTAFLIVTHDPRLAGRCDRRIEMLDGYAHPAEQLFVLATNN
ncbi:MAG: ABC transporter ATP-binding protein [Betaproteobacteria bacterium]|nr:ABC transporter ATP-binding protein [Betaproteobacteria bacterium]